MRAADAVLRPPPHRADRGGAFRCERATAADDPALRALLRDTRMEGWVRLAFPREPSYFAASALEGEDAATVVVRRGDGAVVAMGARSVKEVWWKGRPARVGYLGQLRFAPGWKAGRRTLARAYARVRSSRAPGELPFDLTAVVADNEPARRLLERGLPGLPRYTPLAELVTVVVPVRGPRRDRDREGLRVEEAGGEPYLDAVARRLERSGRALGLAPRWSRRRLGEMAAGRLGPWTPMAAREGGRLVGCAAVWDQRPLRQCVVAGYAPWVARLRPLLSGVLRLSGRPALPPPGSALRLGYVSHLSADDPEVVEALVAAARTTAAGQGLDHLALAFPAGRPEPDRVRRRFGGHTYRSVLYAVHDAEAEVRWEALGAGGLEVEVATL